MNTNTARIVWVRKPFLHAFHVRSRVSAPPVYYRLQHFFLLAECVVGFQHRSCHSADHHFADLHRRPGAGFGFAHVRISPRLRNGNWRDSIRHFWPSQPAVREGDLPVYVRYAISLPSRASNASGRLKASGYGPRLALLKFTLEWRIHRDFWDTCESFRTHGKSCHV